MSCVSALQNSCHVFNFDCQFTHVSHIWPDRTFYGKKEQNLLQVDRTNHHQDMDLFYKGMYIKGVRVSLPKRLHGWFWPHCLALGKNPWYHFTLRVE